MPKAKASPPRKSEERLVEITLGELWDVVWDILNMAYMASNGKAEEERLVSFEADRIVGLSVGEVYGHLTRDDEVPIGLYRDVMRNVTNRSSRILGLR